MSYIDKFSGVHWLVFEQELTYEQAYQLYGIASFLGCEGSFVPYHPKEAPKNSKTEFHFEGLTEDQMARIAWFAVTYFRVALKKAEFIAWDEPRIEETLSGQLCEKHRREEVERELLENG